MKTVYYSFFVAIALVVALTSCSSHDYRMSIPAGSTMVASVDLTDKDAADDLSFLTHFLKIDDPMKCGFDVSRKFYFFETADGNFGMCAKVNKPQNLEKYRDRLVREGLMKKGPERSDCQFAIIADKFVAGWDDATFLVLGPVLPSGQKDVMQQIASLLAQDEEDSMNRSPLMTKLDAQKGAVAVVAQVNALPQQVASLFAVGAPKGVEMSDIGFVADLDIRDNMLIIESEPFSVNKAADEYIKKSYNVFRQIGTSYLKSMSRHDLFGMFLNVDGKKFLPIIQQSSDLQTLLAGVNQAIDMDAIIKSINGDMYIGMPEYSTDHADITMAAMLGQSAFLDDVAYWKKSVPSGAQLVDWKTNAYSYLSEDVNFHFGVQNFTPLQFYASTKKEAAEAVLKASQNPVDDTVIKTVEGKRMAVVMSLASLLPSDGGIAMMMLPSLMKVKYIVYTVK